MAQKKKDTSVLIVDDSSDTREILQRNLEGMDFQTFQAPGVAAAIDLLEVRPVDLVITDVIMPDQDGYELLRHVRENHKGVEVLIITGFPDINQAVEAVRQGAQDYLIKPFTNDELQSAVQRVLEKVRSRRQIGKTPPSTSFSGLIGESPAMQKVLKAIEKASRTSATVMLNGESGTGKELVARSIHYNSRRASSPFIPVNCAAIPEHLIESELFGHVKGAFTGASGARAGLFQTADKGTVLMDEISEASPAMQVKLLRVIQEREVVMLGSARPQKVDVRLIAATNKDLLNLVKKGQFREDLYYRLNVINIELPPLRERHDDLLQLVNHFVGKAAREYDRPVPSFSDGALAALKNYRWPGNVRELENVIRSIVAMADDSIIDTPDLPELMRFSALKQQPMDQTLAQVEQQHIKNVLAMVNNNKTKAAEILGIDRKTLRKKLKTS